MEEKKLKSFTFRVEEEIWQDLRKISYEQNISLNNLLKKGAELIIKKYEKKS